MNDKAALGLIAELQGYCLSGLDHRRLRGIVQQIARLSAGFPHHQRSARLDALYQEGTAAVRHKLAVGVAHHRTVASGHQKFHVGQGLLFPVCGHLCHQQSALGGVAEIDLYHLLFLTGEIDGLRRGVNDVGAVTGEFLNDVGAALAAGDGKGAVHRSAVGADDRAAGAAGVAAEVADLEHRALNGSSRLRIIFPYADSTQRTVGEAEGVALSGGDKRLLCVRIRQGESGGGLQFLYPEPAIPQGELRGREDNASILVGVIHAQVVVFPCGRVVGGIPDLEGNIFNRVVGNLIFLDDLNDRPLIVLEIDIPVPVGVQGHGLGVLGQQIGLRHGFFDDLHHAGQEVLHNSNTVRPGLHLCDGMAVSAFDQVDRAGDRGPGVSVGFVDVEVRPDVVLQNNRRGSARK